MTGPYPEVETWDALQSYVVALENRFDGRLGVIIRNAESAPEADPFVESRPHERFGSASVVKLLVLYALYRTYDGRLEELDRRHPIAPENRVGGAGLFHLLSGASPTIEDLATAMIAVSDNAATNELIDVLGFDGIAEAAADLGLEGTRLGRKMMQTPAVDPTIAELESDRSSPVDSNGYEYVNTVTPRDCAVVLSDIHGGRTLSGMAYERLERPLVHQHDDSMVPRYLPPETNLRHKTGELPSVAADAGLLTVGETTVAYAFCCDGLDHRGDGTDAIAELGAGAYRVLERYDGTSSETLAK